MHLDHVGLSVASLDAQTAWYSTAFGFGTALPFEVAVAGLRGVFLLGPDGVALELLERAGSTHPPVATTPPDALLTQGWGHVCFRVEDVDRTFQHLVDAGAGVVSPPAPAPEPGVRFAFLTDPEGNLIELLDRPHAVGG
ncbi:MAG: VOC family protein [Microbacteriaceae bacterium]|nr:VOC family protein [Microbacteriaceae bacterium]